MYPSGLIEVGLHGTGPGGARGQARRRKRDEEVAAARKLHEMIIQAATTAGSTAAAAEAAPEPRPEQPPHEQERPAQAHNTEVLVCRPRRKRKQPEWLQPAEGLRECATGTRKRKRPALPACDCKSFATRAERDKLRLKVKLETEQRRGFIRRWRGSTLMPHKCPFRGSKRIYFPLRGLREKRLFIARGQRAKTRVDFLSVFELFFTLHCSEEFDAPIGSLTAALALAPKFI